MIEKKKRLGALRQNVIHAVVHDLRAHGGVNPGSERDLQFGAHAIRARHQHRIAPALAVKVEKSAEARRVQGHRAEMFSSPSRQFAVWLRSNRNIHTGIGVTRVEVPFLEGSDGSETRSSGPVPARLWPGLT